MQKNDLIGILQGIEGNPEIFLIDITNDGDGESHASVKPLNKTAVGTDTIQDGLGENQRTAILIAHENRLYEKCIDMGNSLKEKIDLAERELLKDLMEEMKGVYPEYHFKIVSEALESHGQPT